MNEEQMAGTLAQVRAMAKQQWRKPFDDQCSTSAGKRGPLVTKTQKNEFSSNTLLASLPAIERERVLLLSDIVTLSAGQMLNDSDREGRYVYFPIGASVALTVVLAEGVAPEVASVGRNGLIECTDAEGSERQMSRAMVKSAGFAGRMKAGMWQREFSHSSGVQQAVLVYKQTLMTQLIQIAACNRHHSLQQRFARWLLTTFDHASPLTELPLTQEFIATLLGVRREGITSAAGKLQLDGAIRYKRGNVAIVDRAVLECCACECYGVIRQHEYDDHAVHASNPAALVPAVQVARERTRYVI